MNDSRRLSRIEQFQHLQSIVRRATETAPEYERADLQGLSQFVFVLAREHQERERPAIVFRPAGADLWEVGEVGCTRLAAATTRGIQAAHRALAGERPRADKVTARAAQVTATAWAEQAGCPRLAAVIRRIRVRAGRLEYLPGPWPPQLLLVPCGFDVPKSSHGSAEARLSRYPYPEDHQ